MCHTVLNIIYLMSRRNRPGDPDEPNHFGVSLTLRYVSWIYTLIATLTLALPAFFIALPVTSIAITYAYRAFTGHLVTGGQPNRPQPHVGTPR